MIYVCANNCSSDQKCFYSSLGKVLPQDICVKLCDNFFWIQPNVHDQVVLPRKHNVLIVFATGGYWIYIEKIVTLELSSV